MRCLTDQDWPTFRQLVALIRCSPIALPKPVSGLPENFDHVDIAILDWIAAEGRRIGRDVVLM